MRKYKFVIVSGRSPNLEDREIIVEADNAILALHHVEKTRLSVGEWVYKSSRVPEDEPPGPDEGDQFSCF